ncbi:MFS transporter [Gordonibacter urolithinfaciens]|uniref:MFS transporter n=1 Tax=Gordonibacter urolithinfaciens TaxID=1335613 RepID=A0A6N8IGW2_9ACTN|nr:MFS transporter [Gordonibacter urolithinfaciens]MVM54240.1 MFS transporter [Gordonibacter urolithinfaciens]MVN14496.1 MFS transporter [Gordonibacter urolithinfaciens]MVN37713.1 MFS transporter [Gordonibacter urolithinfaciens]MVN56291.1 MFS transporter [Gordonibacter urolithinfaciens]MVN61573.1 MFS transporter [Gordonibacter urolithinfaciens]
MDVQNLREQALDAGTRTSAAAARNRALEGAAAGAARRNGRAQAESKPFPTAAVLGGLALSLFMAALDATIVSTAMPKIAAGLGSFDHYTWPFTSYLLTCTLATLLCGACATRFGHKRVFACGISVFAVASAGCALSNSLDALTAWRAVQGVGGGLVEAGVFIAMAELFEPRVRGKYMGILSSMYGLASIAGPLAGGLIADTVGWHWIFLANLPLSIVALVLAVRFLPGKQAHSERSFDLPGAVCAAAAIVPLTLAFSLTGSAFAWFSVPFFGLLALAGVMIAALVLVERRRDHAIVPVRLFRRAQVNGAVAMGFCSQFALLVGVMFVPRFVQEGLGLSSTASALATIPMTLALVVGSTLAGRVFGRNGRMRAISRIGFLVLGIGALLLCLVGPATGMVQLAYSSAVLGFGIGVNMPMTNIAAQTAVEPRDMGKVTSLALFYRGLGGTVGSAACGAVAGASYPSAALPVFALCVGAGIAGLVLSGTLPRLIERRR